jgi:branched-chain amino acid aminotransferase
VIAFLDGRFIPEDQAAISIHDRGFLNGDGVFETVLLHQGGFFRLGLHLERLAASAATLRIAAPPLAVLDAIVRRLTRENSLRDGHIRITLTRGVERPALLVTMEPPDVAALERARRGWHLITARARRPSTAAIPAQLKALGRTYALLARIEAADAAADDALLLTDQGEVCEGPSWNIFWRTGTTLFTPALDAGVLAGVTRSILLDLAGAAGLAAVEGRWPRARLDDAEEIFASMTSAGVARIRSLDGRHLPPHSPAADALQPLYWQRVAAEAAADPA